MTMREKQILAGAVGIHKENWGVATHFSEVIEHKFGKKMPYILSIVGIFCSLWGGLSLTFLWNTHINVDEVIDLSKD